MQVNLGLAQIVTVMGDVQANLEKHLDYIEKARRQGVQLLCFPELSLTGYSLQDLSYDVALQPMPDNPIFKPLYQASHDLDLLVGFVDEDNRHRIFASSAYLSGGKLLHTHRKCYLPTYTLFDEGRYFARGDDLSAFDTQFGRVGVLICEDFWHASSPYLLWVDGADILLLASASPGRGLDEGDRLSSTRWVESVIQAYACLFTSFIVHTNRVGFEDGFNFWGGSAVCDPDGNQVAQAPYFEETLLVATIDTDQLRRTRARLPLLRDERVELTSQTLSRILSASGKANRGPR
ncbi:MAG: acyltransferase [Anaerolineae bacterium]|nr:acyltransferase [Anaerolineae bacterium]